MDRCAGVFSVQDGIAPDCRSGGSIEMVGDTSGDCNGRHSWRAGEDAHASRGATSPWSRANLFTNI